jgi:hypothetical protein
MNTRLLALLIKRRKLETMLDELKNEQLIKMIEATRGKDSLDARKAKDELEREHERVNNILRSRLRTAI